MDLAKLEDAAAHPLPDEPCSNVAVNYREHGREMAGRTTNPSGAPEPGTAPPGTTSIQGIWERRPDDARWNPYMFVKLPSAVVASGEPIRPPPGRTQIDWECELGVVIGREARQVDAAKAADYIFGYTVQIDVSDRGGRGDRDGPAGSWGRATTRSRRLVPSSCPRSSSRTRRTCGTRSR